MNNIKTVVLRVVPSVRVFAKARTRNVALLLLAAACPLLCVRSIAADTSANLRNAYMLAAQQRQIE